MVEDPDDIRRQIRSEFDIAAASYDRARPMRNASVPLVRALDLRPGSRVLDVACGTGFVALAAAKTLAAVGSVDAVDLSPEMISQLRRNADSAGLRNLTATVGDAEALSFPDDQFDIVTCGLSVAFLPDVTRALKEWLRVLKPEGWLHFSSWSDTQGQPLRKLLGEHLRRNGLTPQTVPFPWPQPESCRVLLTAANYRNIRVTTSQAGFFYRDVDEFWNEISTGPGATALANATPEQSARVKTGLIAEVESLVTGEGIWRDGTVHVASAQK